MAEVKTDPNDSAFAAGIPSSDGEPACYQDGLTKREYFAGLAMQGLLANSGGALRDSEMNTVWANRAVAFADALITALNNELS